MSKFLKDRSEPSGERQMKRSDYFHWLAGVCREHKREDMAEGFEAYAAHAEKQESQQPEGMQPEAPLAADLAPTLERRAVQAAGDKRNE